MSDAITHYRQLRELTRNELSHALGMAGYPLSADAIGLMENRERTVTVDDLMALAHALDTTPAVMLAHIPIDMPAPEGPLATGLPANVDQAELRAWIEGKTTLDHDARVRRYEEKVSQLRARSAHVEDQLQGAYAAIREYEERVDQRTDAPQVQVLHVQVRDGQYALNQVELALALAEQKLDDLQQSTL
ncbi:helix-turn-helix domain-containing protein [Streptomyces sp. NPDC056061]|uniref:helix-turn-helix domain-containing protein n=1 Tax=Streptomyces sp. NPDC056061 TaxID=3345700 RepID=UPI0035D57A2C